MTPTKPDATTAPPANLDGETIAECSLRMYREAGRPHTTSEEDERAKVTK